MVKISIVFQVSFTGSTEVGRLVMEAAAKSNLKHVSLELGGKSPVIVFDDADVDMATELVRIATFLNKACIHSKQPHNTTQGGEKIYTSVPRTFDRLSDLKLGVCMKCQGEICVSGSRVYVQEGIYDEFVKKIAEKAKSWVVGDPFNPNVHQGPQVSKEN